MLYEVITGGSEAGKTIACLGLTFKPETDDMRDSPAITILPALAEKGAKIKAHDPQGMKEAKHYLPESMISYVADPYEAAQDADAVILMTEWNQYRALELGKLGKIIVITSYSIHYTKLYECLPLKKPD